MRFFNLLFRWGATEPIHSLRRMERTRTVEMMREVGPVQLRSFNRMGIR